MKKNIIYKIVIVFCLSITTLQITAQQVNTLYFMENAPERNMLNPAFQPLNNFYLGLPILGYTKFGFGNNSLSLKDLIYKDVNGKTITFLHENGDKAAFLNAFQDPTLLSSDLQFNILNFGFRARRAYWNFSITEKFQTQNGVPKDMMKLLLYGTPDNVNDNLFNLKNLGFDVSLYTEVGLGYSRKINEKFSYGFKLKFLAGQANMSMVNDNLDLILNKDAVSLNGKGTFNYSSPLKVQIPKDLNDFKTPDLPTNNVDLAYPSGMGGGFDLGFTFKPTRRLTFSAAVTDLGQIRWNKNPGNASYNVDYKFTGLKGSLNDFVNNSDSILKLESTNLKKAISTDTTSNSYTTYTHPKINAGLEYGFFKNKMSLGILSTTTFYEKAYQELTASVNARPTNWFDLSLSYSFTNGRYNNIGAGLGWRTGIIHWLFTADYISLNNAKLPLDSLGVSIPENFPSIAKNLYIPIPYNIDRFNFAFGANIVFGNKIRKPRVRKAEEFVEKVYPEIPYKGKKWKKSKSSDLDGDGVFDFYDDCSDTPPEAYSKIDKCGCPQDTDKDGIADYLDKCPATPAEAIGYVDKFGCSLDTDNDGVYDYLDKCPFTPVGVKVDAVGCPVDTDKDGVADYLDLCPGTPLAAQGKVDKNGCPIDTDGDGVADYLDICPNTPLDARGNITPNGCPADTDGDGVPDYLDKCPDTPSQAKGMVDSKGCLIDSDGDGVFDYLDLCANTPVEARGFIDKNGCVLDSDDDGVPDYLDKCPKTPTEARGMVDEKGCPRDTDGDGIADYIDNCPKIAGVASNKGCPEVKKEVRKLFQKALQGIQFETGKSTIKTTSFVILDQIAKVLVENPLYLVEVQGHTDNVGKPDLNLSLSDKRAAEVRNYLISKGVAQSRMTSKGFGDTKPVMSNKTPAGKAKNRRVEFVVTFEEVTFE
jgi:outer membrane protein OmpA-like peptidoglycan-associated protein